MNSYQPIRQFGLFSMPFTGCDRRHTTLSSLERLTTKLAPATRLAMKSIGQNTSGTVANSVRKLSPAYFGWRMPSSTSVANALQFVALGALVTTGTSDSCWPLPSFFLIGNMSRKLNPMSVVLCKCKFFAFRLLQFLEISKSETVTKQYLKSYETRNYIVLNRKV